jgi:hypothetical protein
MKKIMIASLALVFILSSAISMQNVFAQENEETQSQEKLTLSKDQRDKIQKFRIEWEKQKINIQADHKIARIELQELLKDENAAESKLKIQMEKVAGFDIQMKLGQRKLQKNINGVYTPEQLALRKAIQNRTARRGNALTRNMQLRGKRGAVLRGRGNTGIRGRGMNRDAVRGRGIRGVRGKGGNNPVMRRVGQRNDQSQKPAPMRMRIRRSIGDEQPGVAAPMQGQCLLYDAIEVYY